MNIICEFGEACPKDKNICCHSCDEFDECENSCEDAPNKCGAANFPNAPVKFETAVPETIQKITILVRMKKELEEQEKELKKQLTEAMEQFGVKAFENEVIKMTYVAPTTRNTLDSAKLKKEHPDIAEQYTKVSNVSASVRVTVK